MDIVDRNYLIKLDNAKQADEVFDVLHSLGEPIRTTTFIYNPAWCYVGFYNLSNNWTIARECSNFGSNVISFENFMKTFSSKTPVKKVEESPVVDMKAIQEECKKRFPIGCTYQDPADKVARLLKEDYSTYDIYGDKHIYAHEGGGCLYQNGKYATLVSLPEEKPFVSRFKIGDWIMWDGLHKAGPYKLTSISGTGFLDQDDDYRDTEDSKYRLATSSEIPKETSSIPEYVEAINKSDGYTIGTIYKTLYGSTSTRYDTIDDKGRENGWGAGNFKPSTKEAYYAQFISTTFVLPERWCLKITSNNEQVLNEWRKRQPRFNEKGCGFSGWLVSDVYDGTYTNWDSNVPTSYKEITYDQFLTHVLNPVLYDLCSKGIENLVEKEIDSRYQMGYDDPKVKTKPLIEDVQSVSVKLSTKKKNNKFKF